MIPDVGCSLVYIYSMPVEHKQYKVKKYFFKILQKNIYPLKYIRSKSFSM